jgi:hypothetical protein
VRITVTSLPVDGQVLGEQRVRIEAHFVAVLSKRLCFGEIEQSPADPCALAPRLHRDIFDQQMIRMRDQLQDGAHFVAELCDPNLVLGVRGRVVGGHRLRPAADSLHVFSIRL